MWEIIIIIIMIIIIIIIIIHNSFLSREIHIIMYFRIVLGFVSTFFYF